MAQKIYKATKQYTKFVEMLTGFACRSQTNTEKLINMGSLYSRLTL